MEWLKKLLEAAQIKDGKLDVETLMTAINTEFPKNAVPKDTYNTLSDAKKKLDTDLADRDKQLETLKVTAGASEALKTQIAELQTANEATKTQYETELKDLTLTSAIKTALAGKVHDADLAAGLFDRGKLVVDGDKIVGLEDQLKGLKESKPFLFVPEDGGDKGGFHKVGSDGQGTGSANNEQLANIFGVTESK